ncbi:MAG: Amidohydrolase [Candidatus Bathyarchaeota archaeon BA2]|nr:MAG: Amidohydrolase [Candidatus Bathyarchaeota archaeon BA2]
MGLKREVSKSVWSKSEKLQCGDHLIDIHVHPFLLKELTEKRPELLEGTKAYLGIKISPQPLETLVRQMEVAGVVKAVLLALDLTSKLGCKLPSNEEVAELVRMDPDRFIGFASVDPLQGQEAARQLEHAINELGLRGLKLHPPLQDFEPSDPKLRPVFKKSEELEIPILAHTGMTWQRSCILELSHPMLWDKVAMDFPDLKIILAHCGWPWAWDAAVLAMRHPNVYLDIANTYTGTPSEHLSLILTEMMPKRIVERFLADKLLFGSDFPYIELHKMAESVKKLPIADEVKLQILETNASKLLGLLL